MKKLFTLILIGALVTPAWMELKAETCFSCGSGSSAACSGKNQCRGSRDACSKAGCKISGSSSCSKAANAKICTASAPNDPTRAFTWNSVK